MGNKWATVSIDDIKLPEKYSCVGGPFGSSLSQKHYVDSGVPVIRGTNLAGDIFSESDFVFVSPDKANELQRNMAFRGDIVFTQRGTLGQVALIPEDSLYEKYIVSQSQMKLTVNPKQADAYFIYTYFRTNEAKTLIENNAIIGGVPHINLGILKEFKLRLPPLSEQKRISEVSKSIDNKINLNPQINQTLEQISQTLFKSWFVDFDPVIDNALDAVNSIPETLQSRAELRQKVRNSADIKPLPADIRALFPAEFEETELGWVPKGWESVTFDSFCDLIQSGGTPSRKETSFWDEGTIKWLSSGEVKGKIVLDTKEKITDIGLLNSSAKLWAKYTTVVAMYGATAGEVCLIGDKMTANQACCGLYSEKYPFYVYNFVSDKAYEIASKATGSAQQNLNKLIISSTKFTRPSNAIISIFEDNVAPLFMNWFSNTAENNTLTALRDTLLPKLISGELSLEDLPDLVTQTEPA